MQYYIKPRLDFMHQVLQGKSLGQAIGNRSSGISVDQGGRLLGVGVYGIE